jgi:endonuclease/exonuclease/phosphatase family metal-dependent hydrolase
MIFRVCTFNIRFILDRWDERKDLLLNTIDNINADVYNFQEVLIGGNNIGQQKLIIDKLNKNEKCNYMHFDSPGFRLYCELLPFGINHIFTCRVAMWFYDLCAKFNEYFLSLILGKYIQLIYQNEILRILAFVILGTCWVFGTSIVLNNKKCDIISTQTKHDIIRVGGWRGVQSIEITINSKRVLIVNLHLSAGLDEELIRVNEAKQVLQWIESKQDIDCVIIMGDFNCKPNGLCYNTFASSKYKSAYKTCFGTEPEKTFHQDHTCITKDIEEEATLDYILFKGSLDLVSSTSESVFLVGTKPSENDASLYPSDHYGIVADFSI